MIEKLSLLRESANSINGLVCHNDTEVVFHPSYEETRNVGSKGKTTRSERSLEFLETLSGEVNLRLSHVIDSLMIIMQAQINRTIDFAISDRGSQGYKLLWVCCLLD